MFLWLFAVQLWRSYLCLSLSRTESVLSSERFVPKRMRPGCSTRKSSPTISRNAVGLTATSQPSIHRDEPIWIVAAYRLKSIAARQSLNNHFFADRAFDSCTVHFDLYCG